MKKAFISFFIISSLGLSFYCQAQSNGDFRTQASGNWNVAGCWQRYNGSSWVAATWSPTYTDGAITILNGHSINITANVSADQLTVNGALTINSGITLQVRDGSGTDLSVSGTLINTGTLDPYSSPLFVFNNGGIYRHSQNGGAVRDATWSAGSTCQITGVTSNFPTNLDQSFHHFTWNCPGQTVSSDLNGNLTDINGNLTITSTGSGGIAISQTASTTLAVDGNYNQAGGYFYISKGGADNIMNVAGSFTLNGGGFSNPESGLCALNVSGDFNLLNGSVANVSTGTLSIRFNKSGTQVYNRTYGSLSGDIDISVATNSILDLGSSIISGSTGDFTLESGAGIKTMESNGIASSGSSGCIQVGGTRYFHSFAHYYYYRNGAQNTGTGLPPNLSGILTVGSSSNATSLAITNGTQTINNRLILVSSTTANSAISSGTVQYGVTGILEYFGYSVQTTADREFPASSGPYSLVINNTLNVNLHANRALNGLLNLTNGQLMIGSNTLTINGTVTKSAGGLTGGSSSNIIYGGSGASTILPGVELGELTINRPAGTTITLAGNVTIHGTFTMTSGSFALGSYSLTYGPSASLRYNGSVSQTTTSNEFPSTGGPQNLIISNNAGVILHASRTIPQTLDLNLGSFSIGDHTLQVYGNFSQSFGNLIGGMTSNLEVRGSTIMTSAMIPSVTLNNLLIDRTSGASLNGDVAVFGQLSLLNGFLRVENHTLTLNGLPITGTPENLLTKPTSTLQLGGDASGVMIPSSVVLLNALFIDNLTGVKLSSSLDVSSMVQINGTIDMDDFEITGSGAIFILPNANLFVGHPYGVGGNIQLTGPQHISEEVDYTFDGTAAQVSNMLPTPVGYQCHHFNVTNTSASGVTLIDPFLEVTGTCTVFPDAKLVVDPPVIFQVDGPFILKQ